MRRRLVNFKNFSVNEGNARPGYDASDIDYILDNQDEVGYSYERDELLAMTDAEVADIADNIAAMIEDNDAMVGGADYSVAYDEEGDIVAESAKAEGTTFVTLGTPRVAMPFAKDKSRENFASKLSEKGFVWLGNDCSQIGNADMLVADEAFISSGNDCIKKADKLGIPVVMYSALVGQYDLDFE